MSYAIKSGFKPVYRSLSRDQSCNYHISFDKNWFHASIRRLFLSEFELKRPNFSTFKDRRHRFHRINSIESIPYNLSPLYVVMEQVTPQQCPLNVIYMQVTLWVRVTLNDTISREEYKTIFSCLSFSEMPLSNQSLCYIVCPKISENRKKIFVWEIEELVAGKF
jgi:hypothetical protein